jgi:YfiH family protein
MPTAVRLRDGGGALFGDLAPGVTAGFTTRALVPDPFSPCDGVRALAEALSAPSAETVRARQVHGRGVVVLAEPAAWGTDTEVGEADALVTDRRGRLLAVASADCVPILLADAGGTWIAAVHAGWRGTVARILDAVLDVFAERGVAAAGLVAAFGPSIARDRYPVGPDVAAALDTAFRGVPLPAGARAQGLGDRTLLDVAANNRALLLARGVLPENIREARLCTFDRADLFPSYRRDGAGCGRIFTGIVKR